MSTVSPRVAAATTAARTSVRWKIFLMMLLLISINYIDRASLTVAMPLIGTEFNMDPAIQGLVLSAFFWTYAFMQVPGGMLADRFKPRIVIAAATVEAAAMAWKKPQPTVAAAITMRGLNRSASMPPGTCMNA